MLSFFKVKSNDNIHRNIMTNIIGTKLNNQKILTKTTTQSPKQSSKQSLKQSPNENSRQENNKKRVLELERLQKEGIEPDINLKREMNELELERVLKEIYY